MLALEDSLIRVIRVPDHLEIVTVSGCCNVSVRLLRDCQLLTGFDERCIALIRAQMLVVCQADVFR